LLEDVVNGQNSVVADAILKGFEMLADTMRSSGSDKEAARAVSGAKELVANVVNTPRKGSVGSSTEKAMEVRGTPKTPLFLESPKGVLRGEEAVVEEEV
jgi:hypothetical protein